MAGSATFDQMSSGGVHDCALAAATAYCWGYNMEGQVGDSTQGVYRTDPLLVAGGFTFTSLIAGSSHSCGVTPSGAAFCWGLNADYQLGNLADYQADYPVRAAGSLAFSAVTVGFDFSCGISTTGITYCWGAGLTGELGVGHLVGLTPDPSKVAGQP
jgi:alpha-tubulin suppressor-like RCC1 family protein